MHEANTGGGKDSSGPPHWPAVFGVFARGMSLASSISKGMAATTTIMYVPYDDLERRAARACSRDASRGPGPRGLYQHIKLHVSTVLVISLISAGAQAYKISTQDRTHANKPRTKRTHGRRHKAWRYVAKQFAPCVWMGAAFTAL